ncbi:hypothetical protein Ae201684_012969 [Aphanomyces euteiches]|uniref:Uncharacterized protein n=1 Tax=Aphanomyces euteiches TaxID=100861 RepID=A0A6G0WQ02_9STRA|nr:hypothetical protein Ae201684_012969 [Aphanomyces euteiches]
MSICSQGCSSCSLSSDASSSVPGTFDTIVWSGVEVFTVAEGGGGGGGADFTAGGSSVAGLARGLIGASESDPDDESEPNISSMSISSASFPPSGRSSDSFSMASQPLIKSKSPFSTCDSGFLHF